MKINKTALVQYFVVAVMVLTAAFAGATTTSGIPTFDASVVFTDLGTFIASLITTYGVPAIEVSMALMGFRWVWNKARSAMGH